MDWHAYPPNMLYVNMLQGYSPRNLNAKVVMQTFFKVCESRIRKFLGSYRYHKFSNFLGVPVHHTPNPQFLMDHPKIANPANFFDVPFR
jgi:hypothetical protein